MTDLLDANVLVAAHRADHPKHQHYLKLVDEIYHLGFATCTQVRNQFLSLVTHPKIFAQPTPMDLALSTWASWQDRPKTDILTETRESWARFAQLCRSQQDQSSAIADLYLASLAMAHDRALVSSDLGFGHIAGLRWWPR